MFISDNACVDMTIEQFMQVYNTDEDCILFLEKIYGTSCRYCGHHNSHKLPDKYTYKCTGCKKRFSIRRNTIFARSKIPLTDWFLAIYLLATNKKGISRIELSEKLGVTKGTAWFVYHRIRKTHAQFHGEFSGTVKDDKISLGKFT